MHNTTQHRTLSFVNDLLQTLQVYVCLPPCILLSCLCVSLYTWLEHRWSASCVGWCSFKLLCWKESLHLKQRQQGYL